MSLTVIRGTTYIGKKNIQLVKSRIQFSSLCSPNSEQKGKDQILFWLTLFSAEGENTNPEQSPSPVLTFKIWEENLAF